MAWSGGDSCNAFPTTALVDTSKCSMSCLTHICGAAPLWATSVSPAAACTICVGGGAWSNELICNCANLARGLSPMGGCARGDDGAERVGPYSINGIWSASPGLSALVSSCALGAPIDEIGAPDALDPADAMTATTQQGLKAHSAIR